MAWKTGWSWTETHWEITTNPDGSTEPMRVQGGPFYFNPNLLGRKVFGRYIYIYWGFRPTATWGVGYGDEGWWPFNMISHWMKVGGVGNLAIFPTLRFERVVSN